MRIPYLWLSGMLIPIVAASRGRGGRGNKEAAVPEQAGRWTAASLPPQDGRTIVITGASSGVGLETAKIVAAKGATVVLACRDPGRAARAAERIAADVPAASLDAVTLDLASLASVSKAAAELRGRHQRIDVLINNAGVIWAPKGTTADGFETHLGVNHLGHFAFAGQVLDLLLPVAGSRVVVLSSPAHRAGNIDFSDLGPGQRYRRAAAYGRSKLANLLFAQKLNAKLAEAGAQTIAVAAHPGGARTELNRNMPLVFRGQSWGLARPITHPADIGALSIARAAADPGLAGGSYIGPGGWHEFTGYPAVLQPSQRARDADLQERLWQESEKLTGIIYHFSARAV
jgi:NAD(P)-dependent dehydrogenase (short-subunit alcohol dehydrogenase family)